MCTTTSCRAALRLLTKIHNSEGQNVAQKTARVNARRGVSTSSFARNTCSPNMILPIDIWKPVLGDLRRFGRVNQPARPWLGMFSTEIDNRVVVIGISGNGPAARAELKAGDVILAVKGEKITSQSGFYRKLWALGPAGVDVPLTVHHEGVTFDVVLASTDRARLLKAPRLH